MKKMAFLLAILVLLQFSVTAQNNLELSMQFNVAAPDRANFTTFSGPRGGVTRDVVDTRTGASQQKTTEAIGAYMNDARDTQKGTSLPYSVRSLFLFPVSADSTRTGDNFTVTKEANGVITIQYVHRGRAYRITTDAQGRLTIPSANTQVRVIGAIPSGAPAQVLAREFASDGTAATVNWANVWNSRIAARGVAVPGAGTARTGAIEVDAPTSTVIKWGGTLNVTFDNNILRVQGSLSPQR